MANRFQPGCNCCGCSEISGQLYPDFYDVEAKSIRDRRRVVTTRTIIRQRTETYINGVRTIANPIISDTTTTETTQEPIVLTSELIAGRFEWPLIPTLTQSTGPQIEESRTGDPPTNGTIVFQPRFVTTVTPVVFEDYRMMVKVDLSNQVGLGQVDPNGLPVVDAASLSFATAVYRFAEFAANQSNLNVIGVTAKWLADIEDFVETNEEFDTAWNACPATGSASPLRLGPQLPQQEVTAIWVLFYSSTTRRGAAVDRLTFAMGQSEILGTNFNAGILYDWRTHWDRVGENEWRSKFQIPDDHYRFAIGGRSYPIQRYGFVDRGLEVTVEASDWKLDLTRNEATPFTHFKPSEAIPGNRYNIAYTAKAVLTSGETNATAVFDNRSIVRNINEPSAGRVPLLATSQPNLDINVSDGVIGSGSTTFVHSGGLSVKDVVENSDERGNSIVFAPFAVVRGEPTRNDKYITIKDNALVPSEILFQFTKIRGNLETIVIESEDPEEESETITQRFLSDRTRFPDDSVSNPKCPAHFHTCWDVEQEAKIGTIDAFSSMFLMPTAQESDLFLRQEEYGCRTIRRYVKRKPYPYGYIELPYPDDFFEAVIASDVLPDGRPFDILSDTWLTGDGTPGNLVVGHAATFPPTPVSVVASHTATRIGDQFRSAMSCTVGFVAPVPLNDFATIFRLGVAEQQFTAPTETYNDPFFVRFADAVSSEDSLGYTINFLWSKNQDGKPWLAIRIHQDDGTFIYHYLENWLGDPGKTYNTLPLLIQYIKFGDALGFTLPYNLLYPPVDNVFNLAPPVLGSIEPMPVRAPIQMQWQAE